MFYIGILRFRERNRQVPDQITSLKLTCYNHDFMRNVAV